MKFRILIATVLTVVMSANVFAADQSGRFGPVYQVVNGHLVGRGADTHVYLTYKGRPIKHGTAMYDNEKHQYRLTLKPSGLQLRYNVANA